MSQKAVLLDLENNLPTIQLLREIIEHYSVLYLFNCSGKFEFSLEDMTEFSSWVASGQVVFLATPTAPHKEFEYAILVGQLLALLEQPAHIELISAMDSSVTLAKMFEASNISCHLIQVQAESASTARPQAKFNLPSIETIKAKPKLMLVKKYCDAVVKMTGKPTTLDGLKNSLANTLQLEDKQVQHLVGLLMNLKLIKNQDGQIHFRKKVLKQWAELQLDAAQEAASISALLEQVMAELQPQVESEQESQQGMNAVHQDLFKNFGKIDPVQLEVARKLRELRDDKPKDIYELRDLLEQLFPQSDVRLLLKELIEKGYIYWNGHEVLYSHEMYLN
ncbi:hypothetical protein A3K93_01455 [Acinetobacter sp. NCu2D-2]|uniref:hypothetical protein n=1 Tax=Acinetobacter sp. NCu2D-2 TaxID=1608473 RepID=UPI0007CDD744|nr:hypothetical protein [Acinetobacter sp. NCu2D-2]ANF80983.1 hypothetical protein A3K93_01455 [Acinetobacter sp. NCu2D-2]